MMTDLGDAPIDSLAGRVSARIGETIHPKQIILFGSRARGNAEPSSDLDLLIIYEGSLSKREVKLAVRRLFPHPAFSMDLFVLTPDEFRRQQGVVSTIGRAAAQDGVVCYG